MCQRAREDLYTLSDEDKVMLCCQPASVLNSPGAEPALSKDSPATILFWVIVICQINCYSTRGLARREGTAVRQTKQTGPCRQKQDLVRLDERPTELC